MPEGKPAGTRCIQLDEQNLCRLFGKAERPEVCLRFSTGAELCGSSNEEAMDNLSELERLTR
jgi:hypothetical protein